MGPDTVSLPSDLTSSLGLFVLVISWATIQELNICYCQLAVITDFIFIS